MKLASSIQSAAIAGVRFVRVSYRAARNLATDPELPRTLKVLFGIGLVQIPVLPFDEIALAIALAWLFIAYRARLTAAIAAARAQIQSGR
jgi:hypothetical protein